MPNFIGRMPLGCVLGFALASCSSAVSTGTTADRQSPQQVFSAQEKKAARALSVQFSMADAHVDEDPMLRFARCRAAIATLGSALTQSGSVSPAQVRALNQVEQQFEQRARSEATKAGNSPAKADAALRKAMAERPSLQEAAPLALSCARTIEDQS